MDTIGDRLNKALKLREINQSDLARSIGVKPQAIQYICAGKTKGSRYTASIAKALQINPNWLEKGVGEMVIKSWTPQQQAAAELIAHMTPEQAQAWLTVGGALAQPRKLENSDCG